MMHTHQTIEDAPLIFSNVLMEFTANLTGQSRQTLIFEAKHNKNCKIHIGPTTFNIRIPRELTKDEIESLIHLANTARYIWESHIDLNAVNASFHINDESELIKFKFAKNAKAAFYLYKSGELMIQITESLCKCGGKIAKEYEMKYIGVKEGVQPVGEPKKIYCMKCLKENPKLIPPTVAYWMRK